MSASYHDALAQFTVLRGNYITFCNVLQRILEHVAHGVSKIAIIQARVKDIPGFAEKISRKGYSDPFRQMTDLCGARVVMETSAQVQAVCTHIRELFDVDEPNSEDKLERLKAQEFGYRSVHFVVSLRRGMPAIPSLGIPEFLYDVLEDDGWRPRIPRYKAEIQVRTIMQHAWASVVHDNLYKRQFKTLKRKWEHNPSRIAALIEDADECFSALLGEIETYKHHYGAYMTPEDMRREIEILTTVMPHAPGNRDLLRRIARLHLALGRPDEAIAVLWPLADADALARRDLAEALFHRGGEGDIGQGRRLLAPTRLGVAPSDAVSEALLAGSYAGQYEQALEHARNVYHLNPNEPGNLLRFLVATLVVEHQCRILPLLGPAVEKAVALSRERTELQVGLPWTLLDICLLELLRGQPYPALEALLQVAAGGGDMPWLDELLTTLRALEHAVGDGLFGLGWVLSCLLLLKAARGRTEDPALPTQCAKILGQPCRGGLAKPVVIVAGGCDAKVTERIVGYGEILRSGFMDFSGSVICGGTTAGISGVVGDLPGAGQRFVLVSHLPANLPRGERLHPCYEIRDAAGQGFTPLGPMQGWLDILASGIAPEEVRVVGVNGGALAGFEYMLAAALGARVGLMHDSGREACRLLNDPFWSDLENVLPLPSDGLILHEFLRPDGVASSLSPEAQEQLGRSIHEDYLAGQKSRILVTEPNLQDWERLDEGLKRSNRAVAAHYEAKLTHVGLAIREKAVDEITPYRFSEEQTVRMAELEHARWTLERLRAGWRLGKKDVTAKRSPHLVSWNELALDIQKHDLGIVTGMPERLREIGYEIYDPKA